MKKEEMKKAEKTPPMPC